MTKAQKLRLCNWTLLIVAPLMLASGIQLEVTQGQDPAFVWLHTALGIAFVSLAVWHISLNLKWGNWFGKFKKMKNHVTWMLWWFFLLTIVSAAIALTHWLDAQTHSPLGGLHGKMGLAMMVVAIGHTLRRIWFFKRKK